MSRLVVTASPHLRAAESTPTIMWSVAASLFPLVAAAIYFFGPGSALIIASATAGAVLTEKFFGKPGTLADGSAVITGVLLGLTLPPGYPLWMAFSGGVFGIGFGKLIFGGLGHNIFNPALLGRAFLAAAYPASISMYPAATDNWWSMRGDVFAMPFMSPKIAEMVTEPTPLGLMKFEATLTPLPELFLGATGGCLGETSALIILLCGAYLAWRRHLNWRIPASIFATVGIMSTGLHLLNPEYPTPFFMLFSGGLMIGAIYMATDMVTSPVTNRGRWIFGIGVGVLVVVIRLWGGLPEAVMFAILLMNALVPFINKAAQPRVFGTGQAEAG